MKVGNVILAIFLWIIAGASFIYGFVFSAMSPLFGGNYMPGGVCFLVSIILFIVGIVVLIYGIKEPDVHIRQEIVTKKEGDENDPIKILNSRYAKGEISKEEYERMKKDIKD